jgi:hypothetical protein
MMKLAINGTDCPSTNNLLEQLLKVINHNFDFHKKVSVNMELMQSNAAQMATYGILICIPQLRLTLLANIKTAIKSNYEREFCLAMHAICKKYTYNHVHNTTLLQIILKELVGTNGIRVLKDALALGTGTVHLVAELVSYLQAMMGEDIGPAYTESAYGVSSDSDLSKEECNPRARERKKSPSCKVAAENRRRIRMTNQKIICAPPARSSIARSPIELNWTSACRTRNMRATASN